MISFQKCQINSRKEYELFSFQYLSFMEFVIYFATHLHSNLIQILCNRTLQEFNIYDTSLNYFCELWYCVTIQSWPYNIGDKYLVIPKTGLSVTCMQFLFTSKTNEWSVCLCLFNTGNVVHVNVSYVNIDRNDHFLT